MSPGSDCHVSQQHLRLKIHPLALPQKADLFACKSR